MLLLLNPVLLLCRSNTVCVKCRLMAFSIPRVIRLNSLALPGIRCVILFHRSLSIRCVIGSARILMDPSHKPARSAIVESIIKRADSPRFQGCRRMALRILSGQQHALMLCKHLSYSSYALFSVHVRVLEYSSRYMYISTIWLAAVSFTITITITIRPSK